METVFLAFNVRPKVSSSDVKYNEEMKNAKHKMFKRLKKKPVKVRF